MRSTSHDYYSSSPKEKGKERGATLREGIMSTRSVTGIRFLFHLEWAPTVICRNIDG